MDPQDLDSGQTVENLYKQEFELLKGMFEDLFSPEVIAGVLEDCDGDVNFAIDTLTKIEGSEGNEASVAIDTQSNTNTECSNNEQADIPTKTLTNTNIECCTNDVTEQQNSNMASNYACASLNAPSYSNAVITPASNTTTTKRHRPKNVMPKVDYWTEEFKNILRYHNEGSRIMVIMRGAPGSGKSYIARAIVDATIGTAKSNIYGNYIFSADDHMVERGVYHYNVNRLSEVHMKNQTRVHKAVNEGRSPVIVDNTNMTTCEMYPYVCDGVQNGYIVEVVEPSNPWSKIPSQLAKRNIHGVPKDKIQLMLQKYEGTHTGESLIKYFKLIYPKNMQPPVQRRNALPDGPSPLDIKLLEKLVTVSDMAVNHLHGNTNPNTESGDYQEPLNQNANTNKIIEITKTLKDNRNPNPNEPNSPNNEMQNQRDSKNILDEMLKVEVDWDNGETWDIPLPKPTLKVETIASLPFTPKPQRSSNVERSSSNTFIEPSLINEDWSKNLQFMETNPDSTGSSIKKETSPIETPNETNKPIKETSLFDFINKHKNLIQTNTRDSPVQNENMNQVSDDKAKVQSTLSSGFHVCKQEDKYFINLRKMFKNIQRPVLRDIYDNCAGDANWACSIVLDGIQNNTIQTVDDDLSDSEDEVYVECQCEERNNVIPGLSTETISLMSPQEEKPQLSPTIYKKKKEKNITMESSEVLQNIKKSIQISENHYSPYCLNLKKARYDNKDNNDQNLNKSNENPLENTDANSSQNAKSGINVISHSNLSSTPVVYDFSSQVVPSTSRYNDFTSVDTNNYKSTNGDDENASEDEDFYTFESDDDRSVFGDSVNVNIGMEFVRILDELYGRYDFEYPASVKPIVSIPSKILYDLNALWVESVTHQLDTAQTQTEEMIKQDEEFARQVELEQQHEAELFPSEENACAIPPNVPSLKEIMDTELALAIYEKDIKEEWKNKEPQDLAAQMTRRKLYDLFPDMSHETLSELLIAHDNRFEDTVEILMISTGQGHFLDQSNGVNKFVMEREKENKEKMLMAERIAALSEEEYPYLFKPGDETEISMDTVNNMRGKAETHKIARDRFRQRANFYLQRKKFAEAAYFNRLCSLHTTRYETASSYAVAALVQYHANKHPQANVIDLHFLRVSEAENSLDLYIDDRLRKMRANPDCKPVTLRIITGRGKHSPGRPRVKPAIMKRLQARCLTYRQLNPGLLEVRLKPSHLTLEELRVT